MLLLILWRLVTACSILLGLYMLYFGAVALFGFKKRRAVPRTAPKTRFACVAAARNEEAVIANLVHSLRRQNSPPELFDIIVAPNNCTDGTARAAQAAGAMLYAPQGEIHSKGDVLREVVENVVLAGGYDAMCVFDADNLVHPDFLARMNDAVCAGHVAVQGFRDSKNPRQSAMSGCYSICYWMLSRFYNNAREVLGVSALVTFLLSVLGFYLGDRYGEAIASQPGNFFDHWGDAFTAMWPLILDRPLHLDLSATSLLVGLGMFCVVCLVWLRFVAFMGNYRAGEESGSARWGTLKEGKAFKDQTNEDNNLIFTQNYGLALHRPKYNPELDRNLNVLVIGGSGSGKTFNYVTPNIMQLNANYFITDPNGNLQ